MVEHLSTLVEKFPGAANQTRCFTHILNLVAKSILHQFEFQKKPEDDDPEDHDDAKKAFAALSQELELEELGDERGGMSKEEEAKLEMNLVPIRLMLTRVSCFKLSQKLSNCFLCTTSHTCKCNQEL
jgi:hypothetical protein